MKWWHWVGAIGGGVFFHLVPFWLLIQLLFWRWQGNSEAELWVEILLFYGGFIVWPALFAWFCSKQRPG